ncbi:hypothetical protein CRD60_00405 [Bifidobacterium aemilianum]|uniref:DUF4190 domain-containing protein n=1 Tax=Bifidobacterium aemilianum TaxID=2493120 RepID=A0A366K9K3_9BIFI|nr:hypothetical protein [Bifidobacterium aemilianum]RBP98374.1 hypothetical protein CRD60_00405 [Bifidobacterium aemilianum]
MSDQQGFQSDAQGLQSHLPEGTSAPASGQGTPAPAPAPAQGQPGLGQPQASDYMQSGPQYGAAAQPQPDNLAEPQGGQPEYGQVKPLDYGAMTNQMPAGYNPYVFGAPDASPAQAQGQQQSAQGPAGNQQAGYGQWQGQAATGQYPGGQGQQAPDPRRLANIQDLNNINLDDPNQNPWYGHWDVNAIIAFVFSILFSIPILPALMGLASMWRTKKMHMKGYGLALAAVIINLLVTAILAWMMIKGISPLDMIQSLPGGDDMFGGGGLGGGGTDGSTSV